MSKNISPEKRTDALNKVYTLMGEVTGRYYRVIDTPCTMGSSHTWNKINKLRKYVEDRWVDLLIKQIW
jgi:hypothetical protein